jgi:hypothetical protein
LPPTRFQGKTPAFPELEGVMRVADQQTFGKALMAAWVILPFSLDILTTYFN